MSRIVIIGDMTVVSPGGTDDELIVRSSTLGSITLHDQQDARVPLRDKMAYALARAIVDNHIPITELTWLPIDDFTPVGIAIYLMDHSGRMFRGTYNRGDSSVIRWSSMS